MGSHIPPVAGTDLEWQENPQKPKVFITSPLRLASGATRIVSLLVKNGACVPASAISYASVFAINSLFKVLRGVSFIAKEGETAKTMCQAGLEINEELIDANMRNRLERQDKLQTIATGAKVVNFVPIVGPILANTIDIATQIAAHEAKAERAVSWGAKHYVKAVFEFLRCTSPFVLNVAHQSFDLGEKVSSRLKNTFYEGLQAHKLAEKLDDFADRTDALRWKLTHAQYPQVYDAEKFSLACFKKLDKDAQDDVLFAVMHAHSVHLSKEQKANFSDALFRQQAKENNIGIDMVLQELLAIFDKLHVREKHRITPADVRVMDKYEKIKALYKIREHPEKLLVRERQMLSQFAAIEKPSDLERLSKTHTKQLEDILVAGFLHLPTQDLTQLIDLTTEEVAALSCDEQMIIAYLTGAIVNQKGEVQEKVRLDLLTKKKSFSQQDLEIICRYLQKYLTTHEKTILIASLKNCKLKLSPELLDRMIDNLQKSVKSPEIETALSALQSMTKSVDLDHIMSMVGPDIATHGFVHKALLLLNRVNGAVVENINKINCSAFLNKTASAIDILMVFPYGKNLVASLLARSGVPIYKIEAVMAKTVINITKMPLTAASKLLELPESIKKTVDSLSDQAKKRINHDTKTWSGWFNNNIEALKAWREGYTTASIQTQATDMSKQSLMTISGIWKTVLKRASQNEPFAKFVGKMYDEAIRPSLKAVNAAVTVTSANYKLYQASMDIGLQTELQAQSFLHDKAKVAHDRAKAYEQGSLKRGALEGVSWALPILGWLTLSSNSLIILPFLVQRVVPHVLRKLASQSQHSFWQGLVYDTGKIEKFFRSKKIDPLRIEGFKKLSVFEQQHIFDLVDIHPEKFSDEKSLIEQTLARLDRIHPHRKPLSVNEFFALSRDMQQDIFFAVTHSRRYKHFRDNNPKHIVRKYIELENQEIRCFHTGMYKKLTVGDQEAIRLAIAQNLHYLDEVVCPTIEEEHEWHDCMHVEVHDGWEYEQFKAMDRISNHRLKTILKLYASMSDEEKQIITPNRLSKMSHAKFKQSQSILVRYRPQMLYKYCIDDPDMIIKQKQRTYYLERMASLLETLPASQKRELLSMTSIEFEEMSDEQKQSLHLFLIEQSQNTNLDSDLLVKAFNGLERPAQAHWYELQDAKNAQTHVVNSLVAKECEALKIKIHVIEKRIAKHTDSDYMALGYEINACSLKMDSIQNDLESKNKCVQSLEVALSGMTLRSHDVKHARLKALKQEIAELEKSLSKTQKEKEKLEDRQKKVSDKILHLEQMQYEFQQKLKGLSAIIGITLPETSVEDIPEAPHVTQAIDAMVHATLQESCKSIKEALFHNIEKHKNNTVQCDRQIVFSRELIDELIALRKEHNRVILQKIEDQKQAIAKETDIEKLTELKLKLRAFYHFNLRLNNALTQHFQALKTSFEQNVERLMLTRQEELMIATEQLRALQDTQESTTHT